jgi:hypothetical protein
MTKWKPGTVVLFRKHLLFKIGNQPPPPPPPPQKKALVLVGYEG